MAISEESKAGACDDRKDKGEAKQVQVGIISINIYTAKHFVLVPVSHNGTSPAPFSGRTTRYELVLLIEY